MYIRFSVPGDGPTQEICRPYLITYKYEGSKKHDDTPNDLIQNFSSIMARLAPIVLNHKRLYLLCHTGGKDVVKISKAKRNCT